MKKKKPGRNKKKARSSFPCPHCGADVPAGAAACPECGSDETTGWADDAAKWGAEIPSGYGNDEDFDYDDFLEREFGKGSGGPGGRGAKDRNGRADPTITIPAWVIAVILCALLLAAAVIFGIFR